MLSNITDLTVPLVINFLKTVKGRLRSLFLTVIFNLFNLFYILLPYLIIVMLNYRGIKSDTV